MTTTIKKETSRDGDGNGYGSGTVNGRRRWP
jgi:hypothetical protein